MTDAPEHPQITPAEEWAIVELMGHRTRAGRVSEEERFGTKLLRIDIPQGEGFVTESYGGTSIYAFRPCSEEVARTVAKRWGGPERVVAPLQLSAPEEASFTSIRVGDKMYNAGDDERPF